MYQGYSRLMIEISKIEGGLYCVGVSLISMFLV
jgi:hypothetical protein